VSEDDPGLKAPDRSTGGAVSVFETSAGAGPPLHVHHHEDECLHVVAGELSIRCGDATFGTPAGSLVFLPRSRAHRLWVKDGPARLLLIAVPGGIQDYLREINAAANHAERRLHGSRQPTTNLVVTVIVGSWIPRWRPTATSEVPPLINGGPGDTEPGCIRPL